MRCVCLVSVHVCAVVSMRVHRHLWGGDDWRSFGVIGGLFLLVLVLYLLGVWVLFVWCLLVLFVYVCVLGFIV